MPQYPTYFMFGLDENQMAALAEAALRLHGPFGQAITHAEAGFDDEPEHVSVIRADMPAGVTLAERAKRAEQLGRELAAAAAVPGDAVDVYAVC